MSKYRLSSPRSYHRSGTRFTSKGEADEAEPNSNSGRDKSFVYDLNKEPGTVRVRVAFVPRSAEVQPGFSRFDTLITPTTTTNCIAHTHTHTHHTHSSLHTAHTHILTHTPSQYTTLG